MCTDPGPGEPNDTMAAAFSIGTIADPDSDAKTINGMLDETGNDVDWYKFRGDDTASGVIDPTRQLFGPGLRACMYMSCVNGNDPGVGCPSGTTADNQGGKAGCCWSDGQSHTIDFSCTSINPFGDDDIDGWIRIDHPGGAGCEAYKFNVHM